MKSPRFKQAKELLEKDKIYPLEEAIALVKKTATAKFDESVELHFRMGIDPRKGDQLVRGSVVLPHSIGKTVRIAVFAEGEAAKEAKEAGADLVGDQDMIDQIKKTGKVDFDIAIATPDMMKKLAPVAKVLGPKGLMPSPKNQTVTPNVTKAVEELKKGKINFKNDESSNIHQLIGKISFDDQKLMDNAQSFIEEVKKVKPASVKGTYIKNLVICSTMGPSIKVEA